MKKKPKTIKLIRYFLSHKKDKKDKIVLPKAAKKTV